jgi:hypothetical protein
VKIYNYHPNTKEFVGESVADQDPLDVTNWLIPANAVTSQPPVTGNREAAIFNEGLRAWEIKPDYRGVAVWDANGNSDTITTIGALPAGYNLTQIIPLGILIINNSRLAYEAIVTKYPEWKQRNALARATELNEKKISSSLTAEEDAEIVVIKSMWEWIKSVRLKSDEITIALDLATDPNSVVMDYSTFV